MSDNRTLSSLPISVGTGLAIESLIQTPMAKYSSLLINIRTLFRNAVGAFDYEEKLPSVTEVYGAIEEDMRGIAEAIATLKLNNHINLIFYQPSYRGMKSKFPMAKLKIIGEGKTTPLQYKMEALRKDVTNRIVDKYSKVITENNVTLPDFAGNAIIITHHPVDLATSNSYTRLNLLESHTGVLKTFPEFYTKLSNGSELTNIPLNKLTIQVFGDRAVDFYSLPTRVKAEVKRLADEANWSSASTPSFCARTIRSLKNSPDKDILLKLID